MTVASINALALFLTEYQQFFFDEMRIADYGGTDNIGDHVVRSILESGDLKNYHMLDFDNGVDLREPIKGEKFDLGICMDLLEHTSNPFIVSKNIIDSLNAWSLLFVTVPFVWEIHAVPDDFWRFTHHGLMELFKEMEVEKVYGIIDTIEESIKKGEEPVNPVAWYLPVSKPFTRIIGIFKKK